MAFNCLSWRLHVWYKLVKRFPRTKHSERRGGCIIRRNAIGVVQTALQQQDQSPQVGRRQARFVQFEWRVGGEPVNFTPLSLSLFLFSLRPSSRPRRASKYTDRRINIPRTRIPTCAQHEQADEGRVECAALSRLVAASYANQAEKLACFQRVLIIQATQLSAMKLELAQRWLPATSVLLMAATQPA